MVWKSTRDWVHDDEREMDEDDLDSEGILCEVYKLSCILWKKVAPHRELSTRCPGISRSYNRRLEYVEAAIKALEEAREGMLEEEFPMLKKVREAQERFLRDNGR